MRYYELWDAETGNLVASCQTESEALALVRATIAAYGERAIEPWGLLWGDDVDADAGGLVAEGSALAALALASAAPVS